MDDTPEYAAELRTMLERIRERGCITHFGENADLAEEIDQILGEQ